MAQRIAIEQQRTLAEHASHEHLAAAVRALGRKAAPVAAALHGRTVWMINSTAQGGGVSEMLPAMIAHLNELGVRTEWAVIDALDPAFFALTKRIHNMIHGNGQPGVDDSDRALYEATNRANADVLRGWLRDGDILIVHDPQPMPLASMLREQLDLTAIWRCHIGLDEHTTSTRAAWRFLQPYADAYRHGVFSAPDYVPSFFEGRASIIYPSLDPLSEKNRPLDDVGAILVRAGIATSRPSRAPSADAAAHRERAAHAARNPPLQPFDHPVQRLHADGRFGSAAIPDEIGLLTRPIVTQVSRWDRLKGFLPLMRGFALLKQRALQDPPADEALRQRLDQVRLVLAGPDADSIADDPEGRGVLDELADAWLALDERARADIAVLTLPMHDAAVNGLIVNALQRASTIVAQNSLREGFGLTITEAMWKGVPVLSNSRACGPRQQIRSGVDGRMISDPQHEPSIAQAIAGMLADPARLRRWGESAAARVRGHFLVYTQLRHWLRLIARLTNP